MEAEARAKRKELGMRHGLSEAMFYKCKAKFAGMSMSDARRLRELKAQNSTLKRLPADAELEKEALKDLLGRKWLSAQPKREAVTVLMAERNFGVTRACGLARMSRSLYRYRSQRPACFPENTAQIGDT